MMHNAALRGKRQSIQRSARGNESVDAGVQTIPGLNSDGTLSVVVREIHLLECGGALLYLWLPTAYDVGGGFGRFFLARCVEDTLEARRNEWSIYARRPLFCAAMPIAMNDGAGSTWALFIPASTDPGYRWLARRPINTSINLLGPFGQNFTLESTTRTLLILTDPDHLPLTLPVVQQMLDRGGRVTLLIKGNPDITSQLLQIIPIPVEVRTVPETEWLDALAEPVRWADQLCAALPNHAYAPLTSHLRTLRFQLDQSFAHGLVHSDFLCGVGACLACVMPTRDNSLTRACMHGPVFPLTTIG